MNKKRGRPKTNGVRDGSVLQRETLALKAHDEARRAGEKYEIALDMMVEAVHRWRPEMPMSRTEAKRILAKWRGKKQASTILGMGEQVLEGEAAAPYIDKTNELVALGAEMNGLTATSEPPPTKVRVCAFGIGPVPRYQRSNRKQS